MKIFSLVLSVVLVAVSFQADAKRMGGGRSFGKQSNSVTQREATRPAATPGQNAATPPAVQQPRRPWGAMLGGLAAGLGLAWLVSSLGFGEEMGQFLMFGLLALGLMLLVEYAGSRRSLQAWLAAQPPATRWAGYVGLVLLILYLGVFNSTSFIYFQF